MTAPSLKSERRLPTGLLRAILVLLAYASTAAAQSDDFNRPNGTLGPNWTQQNGVGTVSIFGNRAVGTQFGIATMNGASGDYVSFDVYNHGTTFQLAGGGLGWAGFAQDFFYAKVQNSFGSTLGFDTYAIYNSYTGYGIYDYLLTPFQEGRLTLTRSGTVMTMFIDPTEGADQSYSWDLGFTPTGTGIAITARGLAEVDNFESDQPEISTPEPASYALVATGMIALAAFRRRLRWR